MLLFTKQNKNGIFHCTNPPPLLDETDRQFENDSSLNKTTSKRFGDEKSIKNDSALNKRVYYLFALVRILLLSCAPPLFLLLRVMLRQLLRALLLLLLCALSFTSLFFLICRSTSAFIASVIIVGRPKPGLLSMLFVSL